MPISALWWKCRAKSLPAEWLGGQNRMCQSPLLPGSLVALVTMPTRMLTPSRVETAGPRRLSNPDSEPTAHFGEQCPQRQLCAFSSPHQIHLEGSFVHVSLAQDAPVLTPDLQTPTCSSKVCTYFPFIIRTPDAASALSSLVSQHC